jgi:hypothetical protein
VLDVLDYLCAGNIKNLKWQIALLEAAFFSAEKMQLAILPDITFGAGYYCRIEDLASFSLDKASDDKGVGFLGDGGELTGGVTSRNQLRQAARLFLIFELISGGKEFGQDKQIGALTCKKFLNPAKIFLNVRKDRIILDESNSHNRLSSQRGLGQLGSFISQ